MGEKNSAGDPEPWALGPTTKELYEGTEQKNSGWRLQLKSDYLDLNPGSSYCVFRQCFNLSVSPMSSSVKGGKHLGDVLRIKWVSLYEVFRIFPSTY